MRRSLAGALLLASAVAQGARADDSNFRPYIVGGRAAGMGGAFTALADDGSGPYYNPGGLAFVRRSQLSLSASVYGLVGGIFADALGDGHDFNYRGLNIFPVSTSAVWKLSDSGSPEGAGTALALSVFVPDAVRIDDRDTIGSNLNAFFLSSEQQTVWAGATWSRRWGGFGIGASGFLLFGTSVSQFELTAVGSNSQFATITSREDETVLGVVGALGMRWDPTDRFHLGLSAFSPEIGRGTRREFVRVAVGDNTPQGAGIAVVNADNLSAAPTLPLRVQGGVAFDVGSFLVSADLTYLGGRETHDDEDRATDGLDRRIKRNPVWNGAIGAETWLSERVPMRFGFFTDFAATDSPLASPPGTPNPNANNTAHVNRFGGTFSLGLRTEHTATNIGLNLSYGSGTDVVPNNLDFNDLKPSDSKQYLVYVFLSSAYEF